MGGNLTAGRKQIADPTNTLGRVAKFDTVLPPDGYDGPVPDWPLDDPSHAEMKRWFWLWRKPQAVEWVRDGIEDIIARYVRNCITLEAGGRITMASSNLVSEVRQQEDRMGRSPLALQRMRWSVGKKELRSMQNERPAGTVARLRAIDPSVADG